MSLNNTPSGERIHIGIFGKRNAGKSSLMNAITGQSIAIVSDTPGTTTDPVKKAMELLPLGPVMFIDTPGLDDVGTLGEKRIEKTYEALRHCDIAILVYDVESGIDSTISDFIEELEKKQLPFIICGNKSDLNKNTISYDKSASTNTNFISVSCITGLGIPELKEKIASLIPSKMDKRIVGDLISNGDIAVLVVPIDSAAPKGRLILPQQQVIRDILESGGIPVVTRETELENALSKLTEKPRLVITDSQAFSIVNKIVPEDIYLTSFSILMARYKGDLEWQINGAKALESLIDEDCVLLSEGCTHHRQCGDIGSVKLPKWISDYTGKKLNFEFSSGTEYPHDLSKYKLIIHCGGCTLNEAEMKHRISCAKSNNVPITNYGIVISYINGILNRCIEML